MVLRALHDRTAVAGKLRDDLTGIQLTAYQSKVGGICFSALSLTWCNSIFVIQNLLSV